MILCFVFLIIFIVLLAFVAVCYLCQPDCSRYHDGKDNWG